MADVETICALWLFGLWPERLLAPTKVIVQQMAFARLDFTKSHQGEWTAAAPLQPRFIVRDLGKWTYYVVVVIMRRAAFARMAEGQR